MNGAAVTLIRPGPERVFRADELKRVGTAATMIVACGTIIIIAMTMMLGHYNSLAHSGPKAVLDGVVIALLMHRQARWRCLTLLGVVYGLVLLLQLGLFYLLPVMALAGATAAAFGRGISLFHRGAALVTAAIVYEVLAGCGAPIKIYFGTDGKSEPVLWAMWLAELPMRAIGAAIGVGLAARLVRRRVAAPNPTATARFDPGSRHVRLPGAGSIRAAAIRVFACLFACTVPLCVQSPAALAAISIAYIIYALWAGLRKQILHSAIALIWAWAVFGAASFAWNRDLGRVLDLSRTLVLRFAPMALASAALVATVRPLDVLRLLPRLRVSGAVLIPLSTVLRSIPRTRRGFQQSMDELKAEGIWTGPMSFLRHPVVVIRGVLSPHIIHWANELCEPTPVADSPGQTPESK